jgi:SAM-dependent methyltransferase
MSLSSVRVVRGSAPRGPYREFPNVPRRNAAQERIEVPALVRSLDLPKGGRLLEVGCGRGVALPPLARLCEPVRLVGLDIEARLLAEARARLDARGVEAELVRADVRDMPFADASFDVVVDFGTCYHISRPESALREIARVLRDGGTLVYETPVSQLLAHPRRSIGRRLPWSAVPQLTRDRSALLWSRRVSRSPSRCLARPRRFDRGPSQLLLARREKRFWSARAPGATLTPSAPER